MNRTGRAWRLPTAALLTALALGGCTPLWTTTAANAPIATPVAVTASAAAEPTETIAAPTATATASTPAPSIPAAALLAAGATGDQVRELQARLKQLKSFTMTVDGVFAESTTAAVKDFQQDFALPSTGTVDAPMWNLLVATTATPSAEELAGHLIAGPALLKVGSTGALVRELQARLKQLGRWTGDVTTTYGKSTATSVTGYQKKRGLPATGEVDQRTKDRIWSQTRKPTNDELNNVKPAPAAGLTATGLDPRCLVGRVICASKATQSITWVIDGVPQLRMAARFGRAELPTRNGSFAVYFKSADWFSTLYQVKMPLAMFFSGGQAVHYSADFAANGQGIGSHGCVNTKDYAKTKILFDQVQVGDRVVVY